jgi:hypothetical protein
LQSQLRAGYRIGRRRRDAVAGKSRASRFGFPAVVVSFPSTRLPPNRPTRSGRAPMSRRCSSAAIRQRRPGCGQRIWLCTRRHRHGGSWTRDPEISPSRSQGCSMLRRVDDAGSRRPHCRAGIGSPTEQS